jgi:hypothetical protein
MPTLVAALRRQTAIGRTVTPDNVDQAAAWPPPNFNTRRDILPGQASGGFSL